MKVRRIIDGGSSRIEPPCEKSWPDLDKLRWHAAIVTMDTGIPVTVEPGSSGDDSFNVSWPGSAGNYLYMDAWSYLNGLSDGASAMLKLRDAEELLTRYRDAAVRDLKSCPQ